MSTYTIEYRFQLPDSNELVFPVTLDTQSLKLCTKDKASYPDWAKLEYHRCPNCCDSFSEKRYCPVASALSSLVTKVETLLSFHEVKLIVVSEEREVHQKTTIQRAVASYMGLIMATCGCPKTIFLRPMARFHLPLASEQETIYRAFSMYALAQCFMRLEGKETGGNFKELESNYSELQQVNKAVVQRLRAASQSDSSINALLNLDVYARAMPYVIDDSLEEMRYIFAPYLSE